VIDNARVGRALTLAVALFGAASLAGFLDRFGWPGELLTLFRPQYALVLGLLALGALLARHRGLAGIALALATLNVFVVAPTWRAGPERPPAGPERLRLLIANVLDTNDDHEALARLIRRERPDVVGLVELTPAWRDGLRPALRAYGYRAEEAQEGAYGIGLYSRDPAVGLRIVRLPQDAPPAVAGTFTLGRVTFTLVLVHARPALSPSSARMHRRQLLALADAAPRLAPALAICGDLNTTPWSWPYRRLRERGDLEDAFSGGAFAGTWPSLPRPLRIPLDTCLTGAALAVAAHRLGPRVGSDHLPLLVELAPAAGS
jgi:endonuclease/exonuclease/phosphatase (EEP) superfamily protein YafD